jgi:fibronectin type 3 domain-containing protein
MCSGFSFAKAWEPSPETDISKYIISYGTESGKHNTSVEVPATADGKPVTSTVLKQLKYNTTYYIVVTAANKDGMESMPSAEIEMTTGPAKPKSVKVLAESKNSALLSWRASTGSEVNGYIISY